VLLKGIAAVDRAAAGMAEFLGFKQSAAAMRAHADGLQKTIDDLGNFTKKKNKEMEASHTSQGATLGTAMEHGASQGSVAMQKLAEEAAKSVAKFKAEVLKMTYDLPKEMEQAIKD